MTEPLPDGGTPLDEDDAAGIIPTFVATRADLNLGEQAGIAAARRWAARSPATRTAESILSEPFVRSLHRQMCGTVWRWAGTYRTSERNIGVDPLRIPVAVRGLVENARYWVAPGTTCITPELTRVRVHHQMVAIHPFPNGNGHHAPLFTDVLARSVGVPPFTRGGADLDDAGQGVALGPGNESPSGAGFRTRISFTSANGRSSPFAKIIPVSTIECPVRRR